VKASAIIGDGFSSFTLTHSDVQYYVPEEYSILRNFHIAVFSKLFYTKGDVRREFTFSRWGREGEGEGHWKGWALNITTGTQHAVHKITNVRYLFINMVLGLLMGANPLLGN
jgi:hypothetical protein